MTGPDDADWSSIRLGLVAPELKIEARDVWMAELTVEYIDAGEPGLAAEVAAALASRNEAVNELMDSSAPRGWKSSVDPDVVTSYLDR
jgi:hypothetical protein